MEKVPFIPFPDDVPVKRYSKKQLCEMYNIHKNTLAKYIRKFEKDFQKLGYNKAGRSLTGKEVQLLFNLIGKP